MSPDDARRTDQVAGQGRPRRAPRSERAALEALGRARVELPAIAEVLASHAPVLDDPAQQALVDAALEDAIEALHALAGSTEGALISVGTRGRST